jgi:DNA (cytosine-5)-methyltransferase 1
LDESGYDAEWCVLGADDVGAPHIRKRCWILGKSTDTSKQPLAGYQQKAHESGWLRQIVSNTASERCQENRQPSCRVAAGQSKPSCLRSNVSNADSQRKQQPQGRIKDERRRTGNLGEKISYTRHNWTIEWQWKLPGDQQTTRSRKNNGRGTAVDAFREWWQVEPGLGRVVDGISHRLERIRGLGNAQVPLCAAAAWTILYERINEQ